MIEQGLYYSTVGYVICSLLDEDGDICSEFVHYGNVLIILDEIRDVTYNFDRSKRHNVLIQRCLCGGTLCWIKHEIWDYELVCVT